MATVTAAIDGLITVTTEAHQSHHKAARNPPSGWHRSYTSGCVQVETREVLSPARGMARKARARAGPGHRGQRGARQGRRAAPALAV